jgi:hypothetical protein
VTVTLPNRLFSFDNFFSRDCPITLFAADVGLQKARHPKSGGRLPTDLWRSTVERIGKAVGTKAKASAPSIERYLRKSEKVPEEAIAISVGLDRTSVPYEEERAEGEPPKTGRKERTKPYVRTPPAPVDVNYRMDYVGTITLVDADGEKIVTRKYAATHEEGSSGILKRMMADIRSAKRQRPNLQVGIVQDGAPELWSDLERALTAEPQRSVGSLPPDLGCLAFCRPTSAAKRVIGQSRLKKLSKENSLFGSVTVTTQFAISRPEKSIPNQ